MQRLDNSVLLIAPEIALALVPLTNFLAMSWQLISGNPLLDRFHHATLVPSGHSHVGLMNKLTCEPHREDEPLPWSYSKAD